MIRKIKKIFFEVISNTKIFNLNFCSMKLPTTKILPNLQGGLDKGGAGQRRIRYIKWTIGENAEQEQLRIASERTTKEIENQLRELDCQIQSTIIRVILSSKFITTYYFLIFLKSPKGAEIQASK